jgi:hypothetical protein
MIGVPSPDTLEVTEQGRQQNSEMHAGGLKVWGFDLRDEGEVVKVARAVDCS